MYDFVPFVPPSAAWDIFDNLGWPKSFEGTVIEAALKALSLTLYGGYQELGTLVFLPNPPESSTPVVGAYAPSAAQHAILHAVEYGQGKEIASAHSAKDSYWPALFREAPPGR